MADDGRSGSISNGDLVGRGSTARRMVLGTQLRRLREAASISRAEAAYAVRASESKLSRLETGRVAFKERDVADLLTMYGIADPDERETFLGMVRDANQPGWWRRYHDVLPGWFQDYVGLEESASLIQAHEMQFVHGLLQIEAYALAIATRGRPDYALDDVKRRIAARLRRQRVLFDVHPPRLWVVLDESVLRRPIGGREVLRRQLEHVIEMSLRPNITIQVTPNHLSGYAAEGAFTILRFVESELPDVVYIEHLDGALYLDGMAEIEAYSRALDRLMVDAETPQRSRQLMIKLLAES